MKISYSFGIVDLLHFGHINALEKAKKHSDLHVFGLIKDETAKSWLGTVVSNYSERRQVLESVSYIDEIMEQSDWNPLENLRSLHKKYPNAEITVFHGDDIKIMPAKDFLDEIGGKIITTGYYEKLSPSNIFKKLSIKENTKAKSVLMSTKANTLSTLKPLLHKAKIEDIYVVYTKKYNENKSVVIDEVAKLFSSSLIVVRSSSSNEDCYDFSNAGHYDSVLNVDSSNLKKIEDAIDAVIMSYNLDDNSEVNEQVLIQRQTTDVIFSGVIFTRDTKKNRPYYLINYDDNGSTDSVTSGSGGKAMWIAYDMDIDQLPTYWRNLLISVRELEEIFKGLVLDIEFAINSNNNVIIFQVRPLASSYKYESFGNEKIFSETKQKSHQRYRDISLQGNKIYSDMAFWNPSEIIGVNPCPLDYSLYEEIITSKAWNEGLIPLGYAKVDGDLMYKIANKPYISIEKSFESLTPNGIPSNIKEKLKNFYVNKLKTVPSSHDKIEFEIVYNCFTFDLKERLMDSLNYTFSNDEIETIYSLLERNTFTIINNYSIILEKDENDLKQLYKIYNKCNDEFNNCRSAVKSKIILVRELIDAINKFGTPQFSRQARCAFIAKSLMQSLVSINAISSIQFNDFMNGIRTVASEFEEDFSELSLMKMDKNTFNKKYGHLRAGTYDIQTLRYDKINFSISSSNKEKIQSITADLDKEVIESVLSKYNSSVKYDEFINYIRLAIEQREKFKFEFTKPLSLVLEIIASIGEEFNLSRNKIAFIELRDLFYIEGLSDEYKMKEYLDNIISVRKINHLQNEMIVLPEIISSEMDIDWISIEESRPNFITDESICAKVILLEDENTDISGKIVVVSKADPGYDWIFSKNISGLITEYGGAASHMAIRCAEFKIPAAIGCGQKIFDFVKQCEYLNLDCKSQKILEVNDIESTY